MPFIHNHTGDRGALSPHCLALVCPFLTLAMLRYASKTKIPLEKQKYILQMMKYHKCIVIQCCLSIRDAAEGWQLWISADQSIHVACSACSSIFVHVCSEAAVYTCDLVYLLACLCQHHITFTAYRDINLSTAPRLCPYSSSCNTHTREPWHFIVMAHMTDAARIL